MAPDTQSLFTNSPHQHLPLSLQVSCVLKLHGQISSRSLSNEPSLSLHGQSLRPCFSSFLSTPSATILICFLSGFSMKSLPSVNPSQILINLPLSISSHLHDFLRFFLLYLNIHLLLMACRTDFRACNPKMYIIAYSASPEFLIHNDSL